MSERGLDASGKPSREIKWPIELKDFDERDIRWCYNYYNKNCHIHTSIEEKKFWLIDYFNDCKSYRFKFPSIAKPFGYEEIFDLRNGNIVDLSWIKKDDHRLLVWMVNIGISNLINFNPNLRSNLINNLTEEFEYYSMEQSYSWVVEILDSIVFDNTDCSEKQYVIGLLKNSWARCMTSSKDTDWLKKDDEVQLSWAWKYLGDHRKRVKIVEPINNLEIYVAVIASLDFLTDPSNRFLKRNADKELFLIKFKKAWSQKKFRDDGKIKKLYHLPLTKDAKNNLEKLALLANKRENEILESLIRQEYVKECLDNNGKEKN
jgi:hypothetical protein